MVECMNNPRAIPRRSGIGMDAIYQKQSTGTRNHPNQPGTYSRLDYKVRFVRRLESTHEWLSHEFETRLKQLLETTLPFTIITRLLDLRKTNADLGHYQQSRMGYTGCCANGTLRKQTRSF